MNVSKICLNNDMFAVEGNRPESAVVPGLCSQCPAEMSSMDNPRLSPGPRCSGLRKCGQNYQGELTVYMSRKWARLSRITDTYQ